MSLNLAANMYLTKKHETITTNSEPTRGVQMQFC